LTLSRISRDLSRLWKITKETAPIAKAKIINEADCQEQIVLARSNSEANKKTKKNYTVSSRRLMLVWITMKIGSIHSGRKIKIDSLISA
jgi:hypothetical protein